MQAQGLLFLSRTRPQTTRAQDGTFSLLLYAVDRIGPHQVESWVVCWYGQEAEAFWASHQAKLTPGTPISLTTQRMRAHVLGRSMPEIHAVASDIAIAPARQPERPQTQPEKAAA